MPIKNTPLIIENPLAVVVTGKIPVVGEIAEYWRESIRGQREDRLYAFINDLEAKIIQMYEKLESIDKKHISSREFDELVAQSSEQAVRELDHNKVSYLLSFVTNYAMDKRPDVTTKNIFFSFVKELSGTHLLILEYIYEKQRMLGRDDLEILLKQESRSEMCTVNELVFKLNVDEDIVFHLVAQMHSRGLIRSAKNGGSSKDRSDRLVLSPLSQQFIRFLRGEWNGPNKRVN